MNATHIANRLAGAVLDLIMPPLCLSCGARTAEPQSVCGSCWAALAFIEAPRCPMWGEPFAFDAGPQMLSARALATPAEWASLTAAVAFNDQAARLVHALKYHDRLECAGLMARLMFRAAHEHVDATDIIMPVPLHRYRLWRRRYNQAALLAAQLAKLSRRTFCPRTLTRHRRTRSQVGLDIKERERNLKGTLSVHESCRDRIAGQRILLVDDVLTTGSTAREATRTLLGAGAAQVDVVVFALVLLPGHDHLIGL
jgi:ComF family protein